MNNIQVTVVYALQNIQYIKKLKMNIGNTVKDALVLSNFFNIFKNLCLYKNKVGIYNKIVSLNYKIKNGDRIEIYRSLIIDPKERRRKNLSLKKII